MSKTSILQPLSPYSSSPAKHNIETHTLSVLVDNEPGVLARVVGMFSGRGYNIESLTVAEVAHETHLSRITIVTSGTPEIIEQIRHQLERLVPVHSVNDLTLSVRAIERELAMIKVRGKGENRVEAMRLADAFSAKVIDATTESFIFELTGAPQLGQNMIEELFRNRIGSGDVRHLSELVRRQSGQMDHGLRPYFPSFVSTILS